MRSGSEGPGLEEQVPSRSIIVGLDNEPADESPTSHAENKSSDSSPSTVGKRAVVEEDEAPPGPHTGSNVSPSSSAGGKPTPTPSRSNSIQSSYKAERKQAPVEGLDLALYYLTDGDDTEKLIGLSLLKSALLNQRVLQEDLQVIARCWVSIPARFLDRLLRAADYKGDRVIDRDYMIDLAVAVLHLFANLLPKSFRNNQKFAGRISRLLTALKIRYAPSSIGLGTLLRGIARLTLGLADLKPKTEY